MAIRMTGLNSGLDTESIVGALMEAHKLKKTKVENKKTKLEWKQTVWSGLNTKMYDFYKDYTGKMRFQTNYNTKKVTSSDPSKVTATASSGAAKGSYSLKVNKLAASQFVTGGKLSSYQTTDANGNTVEKDVTKNTKLSELGMSGDGSTQIQVTSGDKTVSLSVDADTTINDFVTTLKDAGLNASFDEKQGRFFIGAKDSGLENKFTITAYTLGTNTLSAQNSLKDAVNYSGLSAEQKSSVLDVLSDLQYSTEADKEETAITKLKEIADANAETVAKDYYSAQKKEDLTSKYLTSDGKAATAEGIQALKDAGKYNDTWTGDDVVKALESFISTETSKYMETEEAKNNVENAVTNGLSDADSNVLLQSKADRDIAIQDAVNAYVDTVSDSTKNDMTENASVLNSIGLAKIDGSEIKENNPGDMVVVAAADSEIVLNGATLTSNSTTMEVNGLTLNLSGETEGTVNLSVSDDTSAVYDSIKEFINQYNSVLAEMNKYYHAASARDYDVLTDDEKEAMSDDEIEKWENKIKDSLLRRDTTLGGLIDTMRTTMTATTITASNGKTYSLANMGIATGKDYKEYGLLHIRGDEDDTEYADETNTLENLLNEDPTVVTEVLSGIVSKLYENLTKKMQSTTLSSALTFYNDKEMNSQLSDYKKDISDWEEKLTDLEDRYYDQFTAMEKALANLTSQQNALAGLLGG